MKSAVKFRIKGTGVYVEPLRVGASASPYDTAGSGRRSKAWRSPSYGPNAALEYAAPQLRNQSRELVRKNTWAAAAVDRIVANTIGTGITPLLKDKRIRKLWRRWVNRSDADGVLDHYGQQALVARGVVEGGEVFVRLRTRRPEDGLPVPLQVQLLESEFVPNEKSENLAGGGYIRQGIEFNAFGQRVAYWMYRQHPADAGPRMDDGLPVRVPASEVLHVYLPTRPGQIRGEPWLTRALAKMRDLDSYDDAELTRKKTAAMFVSFIRRPLPEGVTAEELAEVWGDSASIADGVGGATLEPGTSQYLEPGEEVEFAEPSDVGGQYEAFMRAQLRAIASGVGILYEQLTGDFDKVNDRTWRAAMNEFKRRCEMWQHDMIVFQFCLPVLARWLEIAKVAGVLPADDATVADEVEWMPPPWPYINPVQDEEAEQKAVRGGMKSRSRVVASRGYDVEQVDEEIAADNARADSLGLVFDTDPRKTAGSGQSQQASRSRGGGGQGADDDGEERGAA